MKTFYILTIVVLGFVKTLAQNNLIEINGSTNINQFKCENVIDNGKNEVYSFVGSALPTLKIDVNRFDCHHRVMTNDLKKTLVSNLFPEMQVRFLSISKLTNGNYNSNVEVKIMDRVQKYQIGFTYNNGKLIGKKAIKFSDFDIIPPKKLGGTINVKDDLGLYFSLNGKL